MNCVCFIVHLEYTRHYNTDTASLCRGSWVLGLWHDSEDHLCVNSS